MRLPAEWESFLNPYFNLKHFYSQLDAFITPLERVMPQKDKIFHVFDYMSPADVRCVLFGEDPYPRITSACGVAFWDMEIRDWQKKTKGSSLKNILKALLVAEGKADYNSSIDECRAIALEIGFPSPPALFGHWLGQGILLVNTALTYSGKEDKKTHLAFWRDFHRSLIQALNARPSSPYYILWGAKAQKWQAEISATIDRPAKIIKQGHPTFLHQFMDKDRPGYSPFREIIDKVKISWH